MKTDWKIEAVARRGTRQATRFLIGGQRRDASVAARADAMTQTVFARGSDRAVLWWARQKRTPLAVAMVFRNPGRTGLLFHCPLDAPGVDRGALIELIGALTADQLEQGLYFTQRIVEPDERSQIDLLVAAGYEFLADLIYMRLELGPIEPGAGADPSELTWRTYDEFDEPALAGVVESTYADSLDCPRIAGRRRIEDVIEAHKFCGLFRPASWWIVDVAGTPAGCVLLNDSVTSGTAELVYIGVSPAYRGRGLSRTMLAHAVRDARSRGVDTLTLTVDARNVYAMQVYDSMGFVRTDRRFSYVCLAEDEPSASGRR